MKKTTIYALLAIGVIVLVTVPGAADLAGRFVKTFFQFVTGGAGIFQRQVTPEEQYRAGQQLLAQIIALSGMGIFWWLGTSYNRRMVYFAPSSRFRCPKCGYEEHIAARRANQLRGCPKCKTVMVPPKKVRII